MADDMLAPQWRRAEALKKTDRRSRKTRAALAEALISTLEKKPLSAITVSELTEKADVNRTTFYAHYQDPFDMFAQLKREFCDICGDLVDAHGEEIAAGAYTALIRDILEYFGKNDAVFRVVLGDHADGSFFQDVITTFHEHCLRFGTPIEHAKRSDSVARRIIEKHPDEAYSLCTMQFDYIAGGVINAMRRWIENGCKESVDTMTIVIDGFVGRKQYDLFTKNLKLLED